MTAPDPRVGEIEARLAAATPGPWEHEEDGYMGCGEVFTANPDIFGCNIAAPSGDLYPRSGYSPKDDMVFIAHSPADVAYLLAELRKAHEALLLHESFRDLIMALAEKWEVEFPSKAADIRAAVAAAKGDERG